MVFHGLSSRLSTVQVFVLGAVVGSFLNVCVARLRKKLNDDPRNPGIIRTVRNGGYMFAARVTRL